MSMENAATLPTPTGVPRRTHSVPELIILGLVVIAAAAVIVWTYSQTNITLDNADLANANASIVPVTARNVNGYRGERVTSGKHGFNLVIPNGWNIVLESSSDYIVANGAKDITYDGAKALTITRTASYGGDGTRAFRILVSDSSNYPAPADNSKQMPIETNSKKQGVRYETNYAKGDALGIAAAKGGEVGYEYVFNKTDTTQVRFIYFVDIGDKNQVDFMDSVVKTVIF